MVTLSVRQVRQLMDKKENIRNMSILTHLDDKTLSSLTDSLVAAAGIVVPTVENRASIKSTVKSLYYELAEDKVPIECNGNAFLINIVNSGYIAYNAEGTAVLKMTDGALIIVDSLEGVTVHTEKLLNILFIENVKSVLMINNVDRSFLELGLQPEEAYQNFKVILHNIICNTQFSNNEYLKTYEINPQQGSVCFGSNLHGGWAFTLPRFASIYANKFGVPKARLVQKLWGDNFFDPKSNKWTKSNIGEDGTVLRRAFVQFILDPIYKLFYCIQKGEVEKYNRMLLSLGIVLQGEEQNLKHENLLHTVMKKFLPLSNALLEMLVVHLPSPTTAQKYKVENFYSGPMDDDCATAIRQCDPNGPLMVFCSRMIATDTHRYYALCRVFSGTIKTGQKVRIMGQTYQPGKDRAFVNITQRTVLMIDTHADPIDDVPAGNLVGLTSIDQYLIQTGTITSDHIYPMRCFVVPSYTPILRIYIEPQLAINLPQLIEGLKLLRHYFQVDMELSGLNIISAPSTKQLEEAVKDLKEYCGGIPFNVSNTDVEYRETVTAPSSQICLSKSPNKHNRIFATAQPVEESLIKAIDSSIITSSTPPEARTHLLVESHGWDINDARNIWCFGGYDLSSFDATNILTDLSMGVDYINEIKDSVISSFRWCTNSGILCEEKSRGIRLNIHDVTLHADAIHRGGGQIIPAARRAFTASILTAKPALLEPMNLLEIYCHESVIGGVYDAIRLCNGYVFHEEIIGYPRYNIKAYLPVVDSFCFEQALFRYNAGQAISYSVFDHWRALPYDPQQEGSACNKIVERVRHIKGLSKEVPTLDSFLDKM